MKLYLFIYLLLLFIIVIVIYFYYFLKELNHRIKDAEKSGTKAKLTLSNVGFEDQHVIFLVEALASAPVLTKLDVTENNNLTERVYFIITYYYQLLIYLFLYIFFYILIFRELVLLENLWKDKLN